MTTYIYIPADTTYLVPDINCTRITMKPILQSYEQRDTSTTSSVVTKPRHMLLFSTTVSSVNSVPLPYYDI